MVGTTGFFHHIGTFLLFSATVLLIITCISAPVVHDLALLKVELGGDNHGSTVAFGTFGWCLNRANAGCVLPSLSTYLRPFLPLPFPNSPFTPSATVN
jgi:hypothetical protein